MSNLPQAGARIKTVTTIIVTFTEYETETENENSDTFETSVTTTTRVRIDSALGILNLGIGILQSYPDAYLDPEAIKGWTKNDSQLE